MPAEPTRAIPAGLVQYDVPPSRAEAFVGYQITVGTDLEVLVGVQTRRGGTAVQLYIPDGWGGMKCVGTAYDDFAAYGPPGGPDLHHVARRARRGDKPVTLLVDEAAKMLAGKTAAVLGLVQAMRDARDPLIVVAEPHQLREYATPAGPHGAGLADAARTRRAELDAESLAAIATRVPPAVYRRMMPAVTADLADELRPRIEHVRDAIITAIAGRTDDDGAIPGWSNAQALEGDPCREGYRLHVRAARLTPDYPERVRQALFYLELALNAGAEGIAPIARDLLDQATRKLATAPHA